MEHVLGAAKGADGQLMVEQLSREGWTISFVSCREGLGAVATRGLISAQAVGASISHLAPFLVERCRQASRAA